MQTSSEHYEPVMIDGKRIGTLFLRGREIHMQLDKREALMHARRIIKYYIAPSLKRFGHLMTVSSDVETEHFLKRLGFYKVGGFGSIASHRLDTLRIQ